MITEQVFSTRKVINGDLVYRIEVRATGQGRYQQRHIWLEGNAPYGISIVGADPWIDSLNCVFNDIRVRGYEVSEVVPE